MKIKIGEKWETYDVINFVGSAFEQKGEIICKSKQFCFRKRWNYI